MDVTSLQVKITQKLVELEDRIANIEEELLSNGGNDISSGVNECQILIIKIFQKAEEETRRGNYVEAARLLGVCIQYFQKLKKIHVVLYQRMGKLFNNSGIGSYTNSLKDIDETIDILECRRLTCLADLYSKHGKYVMARDYLIKAISRYSESWIRKKIDIVEVYEYLREGMLSEDEIKAIQFFTMAVNTGKKSLLNAKEETRFYLKSDVCLCEGAKFLLEGIIERNKAKIAEAKQKFEGASVSIPSSFLAYKLLCNFYPAFLDGEEGWRSSREKALEIVRDMEGSTYIDTLSALYLEYIIMRYIDKDESAKRNFEMRLTELDRWHAKMLQTEIQGVEEEIYPSLPKVCPNCHSPTSYIEISKNLYECTRCSHRIRVRRENEKV